MSSFRQTVTVTRLGGGSLVKGRWTGEGSASTFDIKASIQPIRPNEVESLPEGRRNSKAFRLYTSADLRDMQSGANPDRVELFGEDYEVTAKAPWQNNVINHYKYFVTKLLEA